MIATTVKLSRKLKLVLGVFSVRTLLQSTDRKLYLRSAWKSYLLILRKPPTPTWERFDAISPQFADVGLAIHRAWRTGKVPLCTADRETLIRWLHHELLHMEYLLWVANGKEKNR